MKNLFLYLLCIIVIASSVSCDYSKQTLLTRQFIHKKDEVWRSDDGNIFIFLNEENPMNAIINVHGQELACFCKLVVRGPMFFTTIEIPNSAKLNSSDYETWDHIDDYKLIEFDYSFSNRCDKLTAKVKYDKSEKYGYDKLYNEGDVIIFRYFSDA